MSPAKSRDPAAAAGSSTKVSARSVLDAPRPAITRYRPAVLAAGGVLIVLLIGFGVMIAFDPRPAKAPDPAEAPAETTSAAPSDLDQRLPATYAAAPGTAGLPPAEADALASSPGPDASATQAAPPGPGPSPLQTEAQAARRSAPFFGGPGGVSGTGGASGTGVAAGPAPGSSTADLGPALIATGASPPADASAKAAFIARAALAGQSHAPGILQEPLSLYEIKAGAVIAAALVTGLNSDLPGMVVAQVTEPVYDHRTGKVVLIPQGARLVGKYDSQVGYGQDRVLLVWTRLIFPSGRSIDLGAMTGADPTGAGGLSDRVDTHLPVLARAVGLSTLISVGGAAAQNSLSRSSDNLVLQDGAGGLASQASQTGQRLVERDLQRAPTLRVRPGFPVRVLVDKDLILPPQVEASR